MKRAERIRIISDSLATDTNRERSMENTDLMNDEVCPGIVVKISDQWCAANMPRG